MFRSLTLFLLALVLASSGQAQNAAIQFDPFGPARTTEDNSYRRIGQRLEQALQEMEWGDGTVAILVQDADYPLTAFSQNETQPMEPGGVFQIVTAAAALDVLGPDFRFHTALGIGGQVEKHELKGGVVVRGDGDPTLSARFLKDPEDAYDLFDAWAKLLRKQGIKKIAGPIVADDRAFDEQILGPGWPIEMLGSPELPSVSALNFNHNCVDIFWKKNKKSGIEAPYETFPVLPRHVFFANKAMAAAEASHGRKYSRQPGSNVISITGAVPLRTELHERASIDDPAKFFAEALKARLAERGIETTGPTLTTNKNSPAEIPQNVRELAVHDSPPLSQILADMMRHDLALHADAVFKAMGLRAGGKIGSFESGQEAVRAVIERLHLPGTIWTFVDGSGCSRLDRISPAQLLSLMRAARRGPQGINFEMLFPRAGEAGALAGRFQPPVGFTPLSADQKPEKKKSTPQPAPKIWAKTGSAPGTEALAGYVDSRFGRKLAFAIMVSGSRMPPGVLREQIDALVLTMTQ